jgi:hypothetical protein
MRFITILAILLSVSIGAVAQKEATIDEREIDALVAELYSSPWDGAFMVASPTLWNFNLTQPMMKILQIGAPTEDALLKKLNDPLIKDQVIFLLGGVGDERAVGPIIDAMIAAPEIAKVRGAERINRSANLALTNITVADVIWHHGGGIAVERCPEGPKECWMEWWKENQSTFSVSRITQSRRYSNYPNYGIYRK